MPWCDLLAVGHDQHVLAVVVLEEEENALLLHETHDKVARRLTILDAVFPRLVVAPKLVLKIC